MSKYDVLSAAGTGHVEVLIKEITTDTGLRRSVRVIRAAFKTVADEFRLTIENCPAHTAFLTTGSLREQWNNGLKCFGLFEGLRQVGFVGIEAYDPQGAPVLFGFGESWYWLEKLAVLPSCRHGGYGERLISFAVDYVRQIGGTRVGLGMMNEHNALKDWYLGLGFKEVELKTFPGLPFTVCFMERDCSPV